MRILALLGIVAAILLLATQWILPVIGSIETAHKPPIGSWLVPRDLTDHSVTTTAGTELSYFGYQFEVPWTDIDETRTKLYPNMVVLTFHSGLKMMVGASPPKLWLSQLFGKSNNMEVRLEKTFSVHSDYEFLSTLYAFTPAQMHLWALSPRTHYREVFMLNIKSVAVLNEAQSGFFYVGNSTFKGFQKGDPQSWPQNYRPKSRATVYLHMFSKADQGSLSLTLLQKDFHNSAGVSQADINRIIETLHRTQE